MKKILLAAMFGLLWAANCAVAQPAKPAEDPDGSAVNTDNEAALSDVSIVLDLERPSDTDIILMRNGDRLTGTVLNESFSIRTSYASLTLNNRIIAGIDLEGGENNIESIITVNNNRFSGFIDDPMVVFRLQSGTQIEIRREKILTIIFRLREAERRNIPQNQFVILNNGDYFSGRILNDNLDVATTYARVPIDLGTVESLTMIGGDRPLTTVQMVNGDVIQGVLETEDINIDLDIGDEVGIYQDRINTLYCRTGFIPEDILARLSGIPRSIDEDFESGDFSDLGWGFPHAAAWSIVGGAAEGSYCARSGSIGHSQRTTMGFTADTTDFEAISFAWKLSSESCCDHLRFYIDGNEIAVFRESGGWNQVSYPVTEGSHDFVWSYSKDGSVNHGEDCAWIDDIHIR